MALRLPVTARLIVILLLPFLILMSCLHRHSSTSASRIVRYVEWNGEGSGATASSLSGCLDMFNGRCSRVYGLGHGPNFIQQKLRRGGGAISASDVSADVDAANTFNVKDYGAKADGATDASKEFAAAWKAACASSSAATVLVPSGGTYLLKPVTFSGACKSSITFQIQGTLLASPNRADWSSANRRQWIEFDGVSNLRVQGGGVVDGNGKVWWAKSCKVDKSQPCTDAPTAITFSSCKNLNVNNLSVRNSQQMHVTFQRCTNVVASGLSISAPESSPNTDGIHVTGTTNIQITGSTIQTGDDCISIVSGSQGVTATNINCGPGHGISIGSLGQGGATAQVSNILVDTAKLSGTTNGVRIKTWQGGSGYARNITFRNINMSNVKNPIIIDQNYCDSNSPCKQQSSAVAVSNVRYQNIKGSSATTNSITFDCSKSVPCTGIILQDINLGSSTKTVCNNVKLSTSGTVVPKPCSGSSNGQVLAEEEGEVEPYSYSAAALTAV